MNIYIHKNGQNSGPFTLEEIEEGLSRGRFNLTDHAWREGSNGWAPLTTMLPTDTQQTRPSDPPSQPPESADKHPRELPIFIIRNGVELGPYKVDDINKHLKTGVFSASDVAKHGKSETLWPLLAIPGVAKPPPTVNTGVTALDETPLKGHPTDPVYAGFWIRFAAYIVDGFVMYLPYLLVKLPLWYLLKNAEMDDPATAAMNLLLIWANSATALLMYWLYFAISEASLWQATVGKKLFGLRVIDERGQRISFGRASGRYFAKVFSVVTLGVGYVMAAFTARRQALHDMMAGTFVVTSHTPTSALSLPVRFEKTPAFQQASAPSNIAVQQTPVGSMARERNGVPEHNRLDKIVMTGVVLAVLALVIAALFALNSNESSSLTITQDRKSQASADNALNAQNTIGAPTPTASPGSLSDDAISLKRTAETSPLRDLIIQRHEGAEDDNGNVNGIWLACADGLHPPEHLCNHDSRTGQVSFSPDELWIVVTDGGGPGSSMGTNLRAFRRDTQNHFTEIPDAGLALAATRAALRGKHVPDSVELGHVYAEVEGWSLDGRILKLTVWGHGPGYPGNGVLDTTPVGIDMVAAWTNYRSNLVSGAEDQPPQEASKIAGDVRAAEATRDRADAELNAVYKRLMGALTPAQQKQLRDDERAWIKWRDEEADRIACSAAATGDDYQAKNLPALTDLIQQRSQTLSAALGNLAAAVPSGTIPTVEGSSSSGLQKRLPNGAVADPYANYAAPRPQATQTPGQARAMLSRVYTIPELKKLVGTRPAGAGLRGDFVLVSKEGNRLLLQSRVELSNFGISSTTNGQADIYRGHTFVTVDLTRDMSRFINGQLVTIPAEQALRIIAVSKNNQGQIDVEAAY